MVLENRVVDDTTLRLTAVVEAKAVEDFEGLTNCLRSLSSMVSPAEGLSESEVEVSMESAGAAGAAAVDNWRIHC